MRFQWNVNWKYEAKHDKENTLSELKELFSVIKHGYLK